MSEADELDELVVRMKRAAMYAEYMRRLRTLIPVDLLHPQVPMFRRQVTTSSMKLAAMAAARQGYDAGRWGASTDCPYLLPDDGRQTFLRRAWFVGYAAGRKVEPRPEPRELDHQPVVIRT